MAETKKTVREAVWHEVKIPEMDHGGSPIRVDIEYSRQTLQEAALAGEQFLIPMALGHTDRPTVLLNCDRAVALFSNPEEARVYGLLPALTRALGYLHDAVTQLASGPSPEKAANLGRAIKEAREVMRDHGEALKSAAAPPMPPPAGGVH